MTAMEFIGGLGATMSGGLSSTATSSGLARFGRDDESKENHGRGFGIATGVGAALEALTSVITFGIGLALEDAQAEHDALVAEIMTDGERRACMNEASHYLVGLNSAQLEVTQAVQELSISIIRYNNLVAEAQLAQTSGRDALATEAEIGVARRMGSPWLARTIEDFDDSMRLARRLTYLAVLASEHSLQVSNPGGSRTRALQAQTPAELRAVRDDLLAATGARTIGGAASIGNQVVVLSLAEDILGLAVHTHDDASEVTLSVRDQLRSVLTSDRYAVYRDGEFVGLSIPFQLVPPGREVDGLSAGAGLFSSNTCAEQLWSVRIGIAGADGVNGSSGLTGIELHKDNAFYAQSCAAAGAIRESYAPASRNLLLDPYTQAELSAELSPPSSSPFTRVVLTDVRTDAARADLESVAVGEGQPGLAGRSLFGGYRLFFPAEFLRYDACNEDGSSCTRSTGNLDLSLVDDLYIRFDYVAAARQ